MRTQPGALFLVLSLMALQACSPSSVTSASKQIIGSDQRQDILSSAFPSNSLVYLSARDGTVCTGSIVSKRHVLTAAHCLPDHASANTVLVGVQNYVDDLKRSLSDRPARGIAPHYVNLKPIKIGSLVNATDFSHDWALLEAIDADFDGTSAAIDLAALPAGQTAHVAVAGYSQDQFMRFGAATWDQKCAATLLADRTIEHDCDTFEGASGGPLWVFDADKGKIALAGIHLAGEATKNHALAIQAISGDLAALGIPTAASLATVSSKRAFLPSAFPNQPWFDHDPVDPDNTSGHLPVDFCEDGIVDVGGADRVCDAPTIPSGRKVNRVVTVSDRGPRAGIQTDVTELTWPEGSSPNLTVVNTSGWQVSFSGNLTPGWMLPIDGRPQPDTLETIVGVPGRLKLEIASGERVDVTFAFVPPPPPPRGVETAVWVGKTSYQNQDFDASLSITTKRTKTCDGKPVLSPLSLQQLAGKSSGSVDVEAVLTLKDPFDGSIFKSYTFVPSGCQSFGDSFHSNLTWKASGKELNLAAWWTNSFGSNSIKMDMRGSPHAWKGSIYGLSNNGGEAVLDLKPR